MTKVVFLLIPGLHLLDLAGPAQAFGTAADLGCGYELAYVAEQEDVPAAQGVTVRATTEWPALAKDDLIVVPGWRASPVIAGTGPLADAVLKALAAHHANGGTVASVCAGADALGRAGLLDGRRCTTHHDIQDELAKRYPRATVIRDVLYVLDGRVATSAGIASGIDLALHLIAVRDGPATAARIAREMVVYARRNGDEQQASAMLRHRSHISDTAHRAQDHIEARFAGPLPLAEIASRCGVSQRTLTRRFTAATGLTPLRYQQLLRLERAEHLIGHGATVEAAARTVGFQDARMLRRLRARETALTSKSKAKLPQRDDPRSLPPVTPVAGAAGQRAPISRPALAASPAARVQTRLNWRGDTLRLARSVRRVQLAGNEDREYGSVRLASAAGRWVLAVAVLGDAMILLEATVVNVALPTIGRDLGASVAGLQWTLNGYVLTLAALILVGGSLSDTYGRRRMFILGTVVFVAASALCGAAPTIGLLIAARFVQGIGGALLTPGSLAIIDAVFHPDDRTRAIGAWAGLGAVAGAIGPTVGGYLTDAVSWRAVFLINLPLGVFVVAAAVRHVPETRDPTRAGGLDLRGAALATVAIAGVCFALTEASGGLTPAVIAASAIGLAAAAAFVAVERRVRHPMLPLELFRSRQFASANVLALVTYAALGGVIFLFVAFLQITLGYTAVQAGAATLPITLLLLTLSTPSGAIAQRIGPRIPLTIGAVLTGAGLLLMAQIHPGDRFLSGVLPSLIVFGVGLGVLITPITATVLASVDSQHSGIASAVNNALSRLGQMIAVAALPLAAGLSGSAFEDPAKMAAGFPVAMTVAAAASFAAALLAWTTISNDALSRSGTGTQHVPKELPPSLKRNCPVAGTPLATSLNSPPSSRPPAAKEL